MPEIKIRGFDPHRLGALAFVFFLIVILIACYFYDLRVGAGK